MIERVADPLDLIGGNFPADDEVKFAATAEALATKVAVLDRQASDLRRSITALPLREELSTGLTAEELNNFAKHQIAQCEDEASHFNQKFAETLSSLSSQIVLAKNMINSEATSATLKIQQLEAIKAAATSDADRRQAQELIDSTTTAARDDIKARSDMLERSMTAAETAIGALNDQADKSISDAEEFRAVLGVLAEPSPQ